VEVLCFLLAERGGFEPPVELLTLRRFSKPLLSTTQPPLREVLRGLNPDGITLTADSAFDRALSPRPSWCRPRESVRLVLPYKLALKVHHAK
jgi:hypothetical protein